MSQTQKYPDPINGYDFIIGRGGKPSYRLNRKLTAAENVPEEIKAQLLTTYEQLTAIRAEENARAAAEEAAKEADQIVHAVDFAGDVLDESNVEIAQPEVPNPQFAPSQLENVQSIADVIPNPALTPGVQTYQDMTEEEQAILDAYPTDPSVLPGTVLPPAADQAGLAAENKKLKDMLAEVLKSSVYEADLQTLAVQLAERFNIYTVFIGREPSHTDLHPITAEVMNNFDRGLAYKQYVRATLSGTLNDLDKNIAVAQADPRFERPMPASVQPLPPQAQTLEQREQSHLNGTVKNAESYGIDGVIQDPPVMGNGFARQVVDPSWLNKAKTIDQFDLQDL